MYPAIQTPVSAGEGKTTTSIGVLTDGLAPYRIGKRAVLAIRDKDGRPLCLRLLRRRAP